MKGGPSSKDNASEAIIFLCLIIFVSFFVRLWILFFIAIIALIVLKIIQVFRKDKNKDTTESSKEREKIEVDFQEVWYCDMLNSITDSVIKEYPSAKWVWEQPNAKKSIQENKEVNIILNNAGGYRKAKVIIENLIFKSLDFYIEKEQEKNEESEEELINATTGEKVNLDKKRKNYELLAYDWVQSNIMELNTSCNEAIGQGLKEILIHGNELPEKESWDNICQELKKEGICDVECVSEGIKINLQRSN